MIGKLQALDEQNQSPLFRRRVNTREREHIRSLEGEHSQKSNNFLPWKPGQVDANRNIEAQMVGLNM